MLTTAEEDRLEADLPLVQEVEHDSETYQYELTPFWSGGDAAGADADEGPEYPALVFEWDSQGDEEDSRRSIGDVREVDERPDEHVIAEIHDTAYADELSLTVAIEATHDVNGVPPTVRGPQLTRGVWRYLRFEIDLKAEGPNGERPLGIEVLNPPTPARVERTLRYEWSIGISYVDEYEVEIDAVADTEYDVTME